MPHIYSPTRTADDWRHLLADPDKQWKLIPIELSGDIALYLGWVKGDAQYLER